MTRGTAVAVFAELSAEGWAIVIAAVFVGAASLLTPYLTYRAKRDQAERDAAAAEILRVRDETAAAVLKERDERAATVLAASAAQQKAAAEVVQRTLAANTAAQGVAAKEVKATLADATAAQADTLAAIVTTGEKSVALGEKNAETGEKIHTLVNSRLGLSLKATADALAVVVGLKDTPENREKADSAAKDVAEHERQQGLVDRGGKAG